MKPSFKIKHTPDQLHQLLAMYEYFVPLADPEDDHGDLLLEHMIMMFQKLLNLAATPRKSYTIKMTRPEARAFVQLWRQIDIRDVKFIFGAVVIGGAIEVIDRELVNEKITYTQNTAA